MDRLTDWLAAGVGAEAEAWSGMWVVEEGVEWRKNLKQIQII